MEEKIKGKLFWQEKNGDRRLMISWQAKRGMIVIPVPAKEAKIIPIMIKMGIQEADVGFELQSGNPRDIQFVDKEASAEAENKARQQAEIQRQNEEKYRENLESQIVETEQSPSTPAASTNLKKEFHNPYNFVPAPPRKIEHLELGDHKPCGHDRYFSDKFSGKLTVKMKVKTPLLVLDTARVSVNDKKHKYFPVLLDENKKPIINPTAVKGMLRCAYEAITNSRMPVFSESERLAYRMEAKTDFIFPALIVRKDDDLKIRLLKDDTESNTYKSKMFAKFELYESRWSGTNNDKGKSRTIGRYNSKPEHNKQIWADIYWDYQTKSWIVKGINDSAKTGWHKGWVYISGANIKNKRYERIFLDYSTGDPLPLGDLENDWKDLVANYQKIHERDLKEREPNKPFHYLGDNPGDTAWSRQIYEKEIRNLDDGSLCYAYYKNGQVLALLPVMISRRIFPKTPISLLPKELHPAKLITQLSPADRVFGWVRQNKPKDEERGLSKKTKEIGSYRGQIRIGEVKTDRTDAIQFFDEANPANWLPLNILGQPKPQQGRFYVAENNSGIAQTEPRSNEDAGYKDERGLRGRKVYPHHANLPEDYWFEKTTISFTDDLADKTQTAVDPAKPKFFREYLRPKNSNKQTNRIEQQRDSQNRSIQGWVKPQTEFTFDVHFTNLSKVELGALVWLLQLGKNYFHRFGGGKPLGFGSVNLSLEDWEILSGKKIRGRYLSLDGSPRNSISAQKCKEEFENELNSAYPNNTFLKAFKRACEGFVDDNPPLPIHYPRARQFKELKKYIDGRKKTIDVKFEDGQSEAEALRPHKDGVNYEWFVENAKEEIKISGVDEKSEENKIIEIYSGKKSIKPRFALPDLVEDKGLPIFPHKIGEI